MPNLIFSIRDVKRSILAAPFAAFKKWVQDLVPGQPRRAELGLTLSSYRACPRQSHGGQGWVLSTRKDSNGIMHPQPMKWLGGFPRKGRAAHSHCVCFPVKWPALQQSHHLRSEYQPKTLSGNPERQPKDGGMRNLDFSRCSASLSTDQAGLEVAVFILQPLGAEVIRERHHIGCLGLISRVMFLDNTSC